jgi:hypothetical protein
MTKIYLIYSGSPHVVDNTVFDAPIIKKKCGVKFFHFVPLDLELCPVIITISKGVHQHPPPPPTKTPSNIVEHLNKILNSEDTLNLTSRGLVISTNQICTSHLLKKKRNKLQFFFYFRIISLL